MNLKYYLNEIKDFSKYFVKGIFNDFIELLKSIWKLPQELMEVTYNATRPKNLMVTFLIVMIVLIVRLKENSRILVIIFGIIALLSYIVKEYISGKWRFERRQEYKRKYEEVSKTTQQQIIIVENKKK